MSDQYLYYPKEKVSGEVYFSEDLSRGWTAETVEVANGTNKILDLPAAYPFIGNIPATKDNVTQADGVLIEALTIAENTTEKRAVFRDGTGLSINKGLLPKEDIDENTFGSDYATRLEQLNFVLKESSDLSFT